MLFQTDADTRETQVVSTAPAVVFDDKVRAEETQSGAALGSVIAKGCGAVNWTSGDDARKGSPVRAYLAE